MIDIMQEQVLALAVAADGLPRRRKGRPTSPKTLYRWTTDGCRGVYLEYINVGGTRCTSREALQRFFNALSGRSSSSAPTIKSRRTDAERQREAKAAGKRLEAAGA